VTAGERSSGADRRLLAWATLVALLLLAPPGLLPGMGAWSGSGRDKAGHFVLFAVLALLAVAPARLRTRHPLAVAVIGSIAYGGVLEALQALTGARTAEVSDLLADGLGSCAGALVPALWRRS
jgi:hypothetical protein